MEKYDFKQLFQFTKICKEYLVFKGKRTKYLGL